MIVKTEDMYGQYICESTETSTGQKEQQHLVLLKGRRPPRIHLIPESILMTTASFRVEPIEDVHQASAGANFFDSELIEKHGAELPFAGYLVWIKPACHLLGEWIPGNVTELENGSCIKNSHLYQSRLGFALRAKCLDVFCLSIKGFRLKIGRAHV